MKHTSILADTAIMTTTATSIAKDTGSIVDNGLKHLERQGGQEKILPPCLFPQYSPAVHADFLTLKKKAEQRVRHENKRD